LARREVVVNSTTRTLIFCTNVGSSGTAIFSVQYTAAGGAAGGVFNINGAPLLNASDIAGGPTSMRAMKCGLSLVNRTQVLNRGGPIYFLNCGQRLLVEGAPFTMTSTQWNNVFDNIVSHPSVRPMDLADFGVPRCSHSHVVDQPAYNDFGENDGTLTVDQFCAHIMVWSGSTPTPRPMSTLIYAIDTVTTNQSLLFSATVDYYTRWPLNTVAGQAQKPIPVVDQKVANRHDAASHKMASQDPYHDPARSSGFDTRMREFEHEADVMANKLEKYALKAARLPRVP